MFARSVAREDEGHERVVTGWSCSYILYDNRSCIGILDIYHQTLYIPHGRLIVANKKSIISSELCPVEKTSEDAKA
jgi:hypothetical protein